MPGDEDQWCIGICIASAIIDGLNRGPTETVDAATLHRCDLG